MKPENVVRRKSVSGELFESDNVGHLRAVFTTFDEPDRDGDIVRKSALTDGQEIPLVWHHQWPRPVGKGVIRVESDRAIFDGHFFLDTIDGQESYKVVKNMGSLQQYSWGFLILEAKAVDEEYEDDPLWWLYGMDITKAEALEVSPVLIGANPNTGTISLKAVDALREPMRFSDQREMAHAAVAAYIKRAQSLAETRLEEGRRLSEANIARLTEDLGIFGSAVDVIKALVPTTSECDPVVEVQDDTVETAARLRRLALSQRQALSLMGE